MRISLLALLVVLPGVAFAAGGGDSSAPKPTETTKNCFQERQWDPEKKAWVRFSAPVNGVWDASIRKCVRPDKTSHMDLDTRYRAVRELAHAGRYDDAQKVLAAMPDQSDDRVLTYWGFTHRKIGNVDAAMMFYDRALERNPDNMLARSYLGQWLVETGDMDGANVQMAEIEARGGAYTWAGTSLRKAIYTGRTFNY